MFTRATLLRQPPHIYFQVTAGAIPINTRLDADYVLKEAGIASGSEYETNLSHLHDENGVTVIDGSILLLSSDETPYELAYVKLLSECQLWFDETLEAKEVSVEQQAI